MEENRIYWSELQKSGAGAAIPASQSFVVDFEAGAVLAPQTASLGQSAVVVLAHRRKCPKIFALAFVWLL